MFLQKNSYLLEKCERWRGMLITCYYYDERSLEYKRTNLKEMKMLEPTDREEFLYRQQRLYRDESKRIPMTLVRNGCRQGFRRKGNGCGNQTGYSRGEKESLTHQGNKEAIASLDEFTIKYNGKEVRLYVRTIETEKSVVCNGNRYEVDLYFELERTEPAEYCTQWNGELWFEIFHTCKVDSKQAEDFAIENKALFEYKVPEFFNFVDNISEEGYEKRKLSIAGRYEEKGIEGILICQTRNETFQYWTKSKNDNWVAKINGYYFTIVKSKFGDNYGIIYGEGKYVWKYNGKEFETIEDAKKNADFIAFKLYNNEKIE